jgi:hypothetical protein
VYLLLEADIVEAFRYAAGGTAGELRIRVGRQEHLVLGSREAALRVCQVAMQIRQPGFDPHVCLPEPTLG